MGREERSGRLTEEQRRRAGRKLATELRHDRHAASRLAEAFEVSPRWMRELRSREAAGKVMRPRGRPRLSDEKRARVWALVEEERTRQGKSAGFRPIHAALASKEPDISRHLVEEALSAMKRAERVAQAAAFEADRESHEMLARDAVWGEDTTHLGRMEDAKVEGEVVKDLATLETVGLAVGEVPDASDVVALLEQTAAERGGWPLVWMADQGSINRDAHVREVLEREQVVHLLSRVHTPTDNAATEHQHRELKEESGLGKGKVIASHEEARARLEAARARLDTGRLRATKGWRTATALGRELPRADALVARSLFYVAARQAMEDAERDLRERHAPQDPADRDVCRARRDAVFATLVRFGLAERHLGRRPRIRPGPPPCNAVHGQVESPRACA